MIRPGATYMYGRVEWYYYTLLVSISHWCGQWNVDKTFDFWSKLGKSLAGLSYAFFHWDPKTYGKTKRFKQPSSGEETVVLRSLWAILVQIQIHLTIFGVHQ